MIYFTYTGANSHRSAELYFRSLFQIILTTSRTLLALIMLESVAIMTAGQGTANQYAAYVLLPLFAHSVNP